MVMVLSAIELERKALYAIEVFAPYPDRSIVSNAYAEYFTWLEKRLSAAYSSPEAAGHDLLHVTRMVQRIDDVVHLPNLDPYELTAAIWLHNLDRSDETNKLIEQYGSFKQACLELLKHSPFSDAARERIADAADQHTKKEDEPGDSSVMCALRALDKVDRFNSRAFFVSALTYGRSKRNPKQQYEVRQPFRLRLQDDGYPVTILDDALRLLQWVQLMPEEARYLIDIVDMRDFIAVLRIIVGGICREHELDNHLELDLQEALGPRYYQMYAA